jgi:trk system potassium uptake protein TrkA
MLKRKLTIIVIGLGNFGAHVAREMGQMGHTVIAVDADEERVASVGEFVTKGVIADTRKKEVLKQIGAGEVDLAIVSLGHGIDSSALATLHLQDLGVTEIWVKVVSEDHAELMRKVGASNTIFPERDMAMRLAQRLSLPNIVERLSFSTDFGILEFTVPEKLAGKTLIDLDLRRRFGINVIGIKEKEASEGMLNPDPTQPLALADIIFLLGHLDELEKFQLEK